MMHLPFSYLSPNTTVIPLKMPAQISATGVTLIGIPISLSRATWAAPSFSLLCEPGIDTDLTLATNVLQYLRMVRKTIVIEILYQLARRFCAFRTIFQAFRECAIPHFTFPTRDGYNIGQATLASQVLCLNLVPKVKANAIRHSIKQHIILPVVCTAYGTGAAIEAAVGDKDFCLTFHTTPLSENGISTTTSAQTGRCRMHSGWP
jgi:hypothetical protein